MKIVKSGVVIDCDFAIDYSVCYVIIAKIYRPRCEFYVVSGICNGVKVCS